MPLKKHELLAEIAKSFIQAAQEAKSIGKMLNDLDIFAEVVEQNPQIATELYNAGQDSKARIKAIKDATEGVFHEYTVNAIALLLQAKLIKDLPQIIQLAKKYAEEVANYHICEVKSAIELSNIQKEDIQKALVNKFQGSVQVIFTIDKQLIGGLEITCGDWKFVSTVKSRLDQLKEQLTFSN